MSELKEPKVKPMPLYLTEDIKKRIKKKSSSQGMTINGYIKMLINADLNKG